MTQRDRAFAALLLGASCIALAPIFPKYAFDLERAMAQSGALGGDRPLGMIAAAFWRMALAAPLFWVLALRRATTTSPGTRRQRLVLLLPGVAFAGDMALWHKAFELTTLANATLLANFATILVSLVGFLWLGERLGLSFAVGALLSLAGAGVLLGVDFSVGGDALRGDALGLATAVCYAAYLLLLKWLRASHGVARLMAYSTTACAVCLLPVALWSEEGLWPHSSRAWLAMLALAWVSHAGGQGSIAYAMAHLPASFATVTLLVQPVLTAAFAWVLFGQVLSALQIFGGLLVLAGIAVARRAADARAVDARARPGAA